MYQSIWDSRDPGFTFKVYENEAKYCARRAKTDEEFTRNYSITWYQIARKKSERIQAEPYDPKKLAEITQKLLDYTTTETGVIDIINDLNSAGVKFLVQSHLSKTYLDGACFFSWGESGYCLYRPLR